MLGVGSALDNISEQTTQLWSPAFVYSTADVKQNGLWALEKEGKGLQRALWWEFAERDFGSLWSGFCSCCRTSGIVLSGRSIRHSHRRNGQWGIAVWVTNVLHIRKKGLHGKVGKTAIVQTNISQVNVLFPVLWERHLQTVHRIYLFRGLFVSCSFPGHAQRMFPWNREWWFALPQPVQQLPVPPCQISSQQSFSLSLLIM